MSAESVESPGGWSEGLEVFGVTPWQLPGRGESGAGCGEWYPESVCDECGEPALSRRVCGNRSCPNCWGVWAREAAVRATVRVQSFRHTQPPDHRRQAAHAIVSPPEGDVQTEREFFDGRSKAAEIAEEKGWRGFAVIPHPFRVTEDGKERYRREDPDYGIWVWLRNDVDDVDRYAYWSPHYHVVGATGAEMDPAEEGDGWVYHFKRSVSSYDGTRDRDSHEDLYGLFRYLLSHTGYPAGSTKQATTWYGDLANSVFVENATEEWQIQKPSEGVRSVIRREVEAVADAGHQEESVDEAGGGADEAGDCPRDGCGGLLIDVFDVRRYLQDNDPPPNVADKMRLARDWRLGLVPVPAGLKFPQSEEEARETWEVLVDREL